MSSRAKEFALNVSATAVTSILFGTVVLALICVGRFFWSIESDDFLSTSFYIFASVSVYISAAGLTAQFLRDLRDFWE